jgi:hypothetical protein
LVLALVLVRKYAKRAGFPVGPVLMLSYKNHALDEFLCDVLKSSATSGRHSHHSHSDNALTPGKLVRCGKPDNEELLAYTERNSPAERKLQDVLVHRITIQRKARKISQSWMETTGDIEWEASTSKVTLAAFLHVCELSH